MSQDIMLEKKVWAVVGATQNTEKYGYRLYKHLKNNGYTVYAVNPSYDTIDADPCYKNLSIAAGSAGGRRYGRITQDRQSGDRRSGQTRD